MKQLTARSEMEAAIEAILLVSTEPVPPLRLLELFEEGEREEAQAALDAVVARHQASDERGIWLEEVAGGLRLATRPELNSWLRKFFEMSGANKFSMAALETLAIIAYRQPITGPEIQDLRSVSPAGVLKTLLEKRLIRIAGRKPVVGKPFLYGTTREFLMHFGLRSLSDLPPLEEFEETFGEGVSSEGGPRSQLVIGEGGLVDRFVEEIDRDTEIRLQAEALEETSDGDERESADESLRHRAMEVIDEVEDPEEALAPLALGVGEPESEEDA